MDTISHRRETDWSESVSIVTGGCDCDTFQYIVFCVVCSFSISETHGMVRTSGTLDETPVPGFENLRDFFLKLIATGARAERDS